MVESFSENFQEIRIPVNIGIPISQIISGLVSRKILGIVFIGKFREFSGYTLPKNSRVSHFPETCVSRKKIPGNLFNFRKIHSAPVSLEMRKFLFTGFPGIPGHLEANKEYKDEPKEMVQPEIHKEHPCTKSCIQYAKIYFYLLIKTTKRRPKREGLSRNTERITQRCTRS